MIDPFEDHCWQDVIPPDVLKVYAKYKRPLSIKGPLALVAIDLYELVYQGGNRPVVEICEQYPSTCGEYAWAAIEPTKRLFAAARKAGLPVFYSADTPPEGRPNFMNVTKKKDTAGDDLLAIRSDFKPEPNDVVVRKQRASAFFGTPLVAHLNMLGIRTIVMCGESTSGCLRASCVDAFSYGFNIVLVEECCFDRALISHKINLFDLHHKYADVVGIDVIAKHLADLEVRKAS